MAKKKKLSRKDKIWNKFCDLEPAAKYGLVHDMCEIYDDFRERLINPKEFGMTLAELEADVNDLYKRRKEK